MEIGFRAFILSSLHRFDLFFASQKRCWNDCRSGLAVPCFVQPEKNKKKIAQKEFLLLPLLPSNVLQESL